ncbi:hypothetical protein F383_38079 [Gossypium arboreum]|uniref:Uncharacterized protein n=1 Tax=Gossypium arboreum TaxID=29729 RepID=A0A0B0MEF1_GOSAR|nr:hypothetical protein F383_38079 [Gossypium arboreum]
MGLCSFLESYICTAEKILVTVKPVIAMLIIYKS